MWYQSGQYLSCISGLTLCSVMMHSTTKQMPAAPNPPMPAQGVLGIKIIHKQDKLVSVNREHELYQAHTADASPAGASSSASPSAAAARAEAAPSSSGRISVTFSYR